MIGLIVNPIAGLGGAVGLKGTDGPSTPEHAIELGAKPLSSERAKRAMEIVMRSLPDLPIVTVQAPMGSQCFKPHDGLSVLDREGPPSAQETSRMARRLGDMGVDLILFSGGDGTARDIAAVIGLEIPILGIPSGVKMHSGVFATTPEAAGRLVVDVFSREQKRVGYRKAEIMDIDEAELKSGRLSATLFGYARAPYSRQLLQAAKRGPAYTDEQIIADTAKEIVANMKDDVFYLIGPGSSANAIIEQLGASGTLLGVDIVLNKNLIVKDVTESEAMALIGDRPIRLILGVTGQQGFVLGRGNQQIGPDAIRRAGRCGLIFIASAEKLSELREPVLRVDTGDPELDASLAGHFRVHTAPRRTMMMRLA